MGHGLIGALILIADIWAIVSILQSRETTATKAVWVILVLVLPLVGLLIWYFAGPKATRT